VLEAGVHAPNGANSQSWHFVVIKDVAIKKAVQVWYKKALDEIVGPRYETAEPLVGLSPEKYHRQDIPGGPKHFARCPRAWIGCQP
jgi:nitroreductase